jgi:hypothetical protein
VEAIEHQRHANRVIGAPYFDCFNPKARFPAESMFGESTPIAFGHFTVFGFGSRGANHGQTEYK